MALEEAGDPTAADEHHPGNLTQTTDGGGHAGGPTTRGRLSSLPRPRQEERQQFGAAVRPPLPLQQRRQLGALLRELHEGAPSGGGGQRKLYRRLAAMRDVVAELPTMINEGGDSLAKISADEIQLRSAAAAAAPPVYSGADGAQNTKPQMEEECSDGQLGKRQHGAETDAAGVHSAVQPGGSKAEAKKRRTEELTQELHDRFAEASKQRTQKGRFIWTEELHDRFVQAVTELGGPEHIKAVPTRILEQMNKKGGAIPGIERNHIASHLQKYRIKMKASKPLRPKHDALESTPGYPSGVFGEKPWQQQQQWPGWPGLHRMWTQIDDEVMLQNTQQAAAAIAVANAADAAAPRPGAAPGLNNRPAARGPSHGSGAPGSLPSLSVLSDRPLTAPPGPPLMALAMAACARPTLRSSPAAARRTPHYPAAAAAAHQTLTAGLSAEQMAFMERKKATAAETQGGLSAEQMAFLERKKAGQQAQVAAAPAAQAAAAPAARAFWFKHAPLSFFALDQMTYKGKRINVDVGDPEDYTRPLVKGLASGAFSCGSWVCTEGGWDSPNGKKATEWFYVLSGAGAVTDPDGTRHNFRAGDVVVLPKHWYGRWDITEQIHKIWINDDHEDIPGAPTTPVVAPLTSFEPHLLLPAGTSPERHARTFYENGRVHAGFWSCAPGSFAHAPRAASTAECVHVLSGTFFLTNTDGSARRITAGDTVVLPDGWTGQWDVIEHTQAVRASVTP